MTKIHLKKIFATINKKILWQNYRKVRNPINYQNEKSKKRLDVIKRKTSIGQPIQKEQRKIH